MVATSLFSVNVPGSRARNLTFGLLRPVTQEVHARGLRQSRGASPTTHTTSRCSGHERRVVENRNGKPSRSTHQEPGDSLCSERLRVRLKD